MSGHTPTREDSVKKTFVLTFVLGLAVAMATPCIHAQQSYILGGFNLPHVDVIIVNKTDDNTPLETSVDNAYAKGYLQQDSQHIWQFDETAFGYNGPARVEVMIKACRVLRTPSADALNGPPSWATDEKFLGTLALTDAYLETDPGERDLGSHVNAIKSFLDRRGELTRKQMKKDLDSWFKEVRRAGLRQTAPLCSTADAQLIVGTVDVTSYWGRRPYVIEVTGNRDEGYKATHRP